MDYAGWNIDITSFTMLLVTRLWGLSWSYRDGFLSINDMKNQGQKDRRIVHLPTLFEYMGFVHFANGCIIGPFLEYVDYKNWVELKDHYENMPRGNWSTVGPALKRFGQALACCGFHLFLTVYLGFNVSFCGTLEFRNY